MLTIVYQFQIGHVKLSEKPIIKLDQIIDDANDTIYLFITDSSGKQWRQLLEQKSTGKNISIKSKLFQDHFYLQVQDSHGVLSRLVSYI